MQPLRPAIRHYPWGSTTLIPELAGQPATGDPVAELWFGAHATGPAYVAQPDGALKGLDEIIAADPEYHLGARVQKQWGSRLPFMLKLLAAGEPLSLQAHPSLAEAEEGFARENAAGLALDDPRRNYKDSNHKPELIVALTPFRGLAGFRKASSTHKLFSVLNCPELAPYAELLENVEEDNEAAQLHTLFRRWVTLAEDERKHLISVIVDKACEVLADESSWQSYSEWMLDSLRTVVDLQRRYPGDIGVLSALLLHHVSMQPGEALRLEAGQLHAYLSGLGVEIMASSDNVLRGGLTEKHVDVPELLSLLQFSSVRDPIMEPELIAEGQYNYPSHTEDFLLERVQLTSQHPRVRCDYDGPAIALVTRGAVECNGRMLRPTEAVWLPAGAADNGFVLVDADESVHDGMRAGAVSGAELFIARV